MSGCRRPPGAQEVKREERSGDEKVKGLEESMRRRDKTGRPGTMNKQRRRAGKATGEATTKVGGLRVEPRDARLETEISLPTS